MEVMKAALDYLKKAKEEFVYVTWPKRDEAIRLTLLVIGGSLLVGFFVGGVDTLLLRGLDFLFRFLAGQG